MLFTSTNEAFGRLPASLVQKLTDPASLQLLTTVLAYHAVAGPAPISFSDRQQFATVAGDNVTVYFIGDILQRTVNFAQILSFQPIRCQNGVIFVIDNVLVPSGVAPAFPYNPYRVPAGRLQRV